jgi:hypothetical protein
MGRLVFLKDEINETREDGHAHSLGFFDPNGFPLDLFFLRKNVHSAGIEMKQRT